MEIFVCVKRVPDTGENEIELDSGSNGIKRDDLVYSINEWDNYAVEEAIQIREKHGGSVTVVTVDNEEGDEVLRREMAMGADRGVLVMDKAFEGSDGRGIASILKAVVEKEHYDLVLTGVQADDGAAQIGGLLAAMLGWPYASIVNEIEILDEKKIRIHREVAGGNLEVYEVDLPCVLSVQTGINEPRYVPIRGVMKAAGLDVPVYGTADLGLSPESVGEAGATVKVKNYFVPEAGDRAEMLEGSTEEIIDKLIDLLKSKGGVR
ncbi:MAG: electron transfer flavoprotein subunit beta/FixA family protein [Deltaproteobacteria bacterium]|nr:electron transfer flavoprotein subunit beta/FixA family protein [Deltaproteobacteria bacterium]MBW2053343.1 electron transfer flavoprotein subunit beta/FixA family protein [Deltaproteobacteria bacterium]MBW2141013.1 electron transfer flavoprotein subunit beta/FixA family protein [Deltaproteobacteria bacterium]MBW2322795.1 electron transfer flavoprotein subunit beta/FixA family protein [Deltaproteobacteria bacterium]